MKDILTIFNEAGFEAYVVGGTCRDIIMGKMPHDTDIATNATPDQIIQVAEVYNLKWIPTGIDHGTISIIFNEEEIQVTTFRIDKKTDGRHAKVEWTLSLIDDLARRDFTVNAIATNQEVIIDPFCGITDIEKKIIRAVGNPIHRFNGNPLYPEDKGDRLRILRAIRFATTLDFIIEAGTWEAIKNTNLDGISAERIRDEFIKIMIHPNRMKGFRLLEDSGLLKQIIPEMEAMKNIAAGNQEHHPEKDIWIHTFIALSKLPRNASLELVLATLLHDIGKPPTWDNYHFHGHEEIGAIMAENILRRIKFPVNIIDKVKWLIANHMRIHKFNEMRTAKKVRLIQEPLFDELFELLRADLMVEDEVVRDIIEFIDNYKPTPSPSRLINGHDILALGVLPGKRIGEILTEIEDLILEGAIITREGALKVVAEMIKS